MKVFAFILLLFSVTSFSVYEKIPLNTFIAKVRKEIKQFFAFHYIEELSFDNFVYKVGDEECTLSSVKSKAVFFNSYMPIATVEDEVNLTLQYYWTAPVNASSYISPYHSLYTAEIIYNNISYQIEFELESKEFKFIKTWELYEEDKFYVPKGSVEITFVSLKAKNLDQRSPFSTKILLDIINAFLAKNKEMMDKTLNDGIVAYYKSLPFEELGQKVFVQTSTIPLENNFDLTLEEKPSYYNTSDGIEYIIMKRKGKLNGEEFQGGDPLLELNETQNFNIYGGVYQKLLINNTFKIEFEQTNNPSTMYQLTGEYLKKVGQVEIDDNAQLKVEAVMDGITFDTTNPMLSEVTFQVSIINFDNSTIVFGFTLTIQFSLTPTIFQSGLNFALLSKNIYQKDIKEIPDYKIIDSGTLILWIENTYLSALGKNEYNLFTSAMDLSYYFNTNDLKWEFKGLYLSIEKN